MSKRSKLGRGLFYTRDSGGEHETTPSEYVRWAQRRAEELKITFAGTPEIIEAMIRNGQASCGDTFLDYVVKGNVLERPGLSALMREIDSDLNVSHVMIARRDRLSRPDDPADGVIIEREIRKKGVALVFMDRTLLPYQSGRRDISEDIVAIIDYHRAGRERHDLAQKVIHAQISLARAGYSTGGRPPFGFRRVLVNADGARIRELSEGEYVKIAYHHVVWVPGPEDEQKLIRRILALLESMPASQVARTLTAEGVPPPDAGRFRTDGGVRHATSGVWHQQTIVNIARNPLLRAVVDYGRRSMGDQLRFTPTGPRELDDEVDLNDGKPKVISNPESKRITAPARFAPLIDADRHERLIAMLDDRAGSQRGKPRARGAAPNPLGGRIFDCDCGWPLYRQPYGATFRYLCGYYQQSHGKKCEHNAVNGPIAAQFLLSCIQQRLSDPAVRDALEKRIRKIAEREELHQSPEIECGAKERELAELKLQLERASKNMALADGREQYYAVAKVFDELKAREQILESAVRDVKNATVPDTNIQNEVGKALAGLDAIINLARNATEMSHLGTLFQRLNARLFLWFKRVKWKNREVNRVAGGFVAFGASPSPVKLYEGPTSRRKLYAHKMLDSDGIADKVVTNDSPNLVSSGERDSLGKINRGERI